MCKTEWTGNDFVGERAAAGMKEKPKKRRSGLSNGDSVAREQASHEAHDDDEANEPTVVDDDDED